MEIVLVAKSLYDTETCECVQLECENFGVRNGDKCECPAGFNGETCSETPYTGKNDKLKNLKTFKCSNNMKGPLCTLCKNSKTCTYEPVRVVQTMFCEADRLPVLQILDNLHFLFSRSRDNLDMLVSLWNDRGLITAIKGTNCNIYRLPGNGDRWECSDLSYSRFHQSAFGSKVAYDTIVADFAKSIREKKLKSTSQLSVSCNYALVTSCSIHVAPFSKHFDELKLNCTAGENPVGPAANDREWAESGSAGWDIAVYVNTAFLALMAIVLLVMAKINQARFRKNAKPRDPKNHPYKFDNVLYYIPLGRKNVKKVILDNISGQLDAGTVTALMGPSGSGKSSLLDVLAHVRMSGNSKVAGSFVYGDSAIKPGSQSFRMCVGYVPQQDCLVPWLTVEETLWFAARTRLPESTPDEEKQKIVHQTLHELNLWSVRGTIVGTPGPLAGGSTGGSKRKNGAGQSRGLSGGEMRRLSIAIEFVAGSNIIFLDEPTSGLDAHNAHNIVVSLKKLAQDHNKTIICSIHQPRPDVFAIFDQLILLSHGKLLYSGSVEGLDDFFVGIEAPRPVSQSIADYAIEYAITSVDVDDIVVGNTEASDLKKFKRYDGHVVSAWTQAKCLLVRSYLALFRNRTKFLGTYLFGIILAFVIGLFYWNVSTEITGFHNRMTSIIFLQLLISLASLSSIFELSREIPVFKHERANGSYRPYLLGVSKIFSELIPLRLVPTVLSSLIVYFMVGFQNEIGKFMIFISTLTLFSVGCFLLANIVGLLLNSDLGLASLTFSMIVLMGQGFSGVSINLLTLSNKWYISWLQYLSLFRYATETLAVTEASELFFTTISEGIVQKPSGRFLLIEFFGFSPGTEMRNIACLIWYNMVLFALFLYIIMFHVHYHR